MSRPFSVSIILLTALAVSGCGPTSMPPESSTLPAGLPPSSVAGPREARDGTAPASAGTALSSVADGTGAAPTKVTLLLDWVPNTNHTGVFVAEAKGYFADEGLDVEVIQPGAVMAQQAVISGIAEFGIDFQEQVTIAQADGRPLVSIAAVIQHNTSGFAAPADRQVTTPRDWEGLRYGSFGSPFEEPTIRVMMGCDGGDFQRLEIVNTGFADPLALLAEEQISLAWIFYGWQGLQAEQHELALDVVMMDEWFDCVPDYYTPIVITSNEMIEVRPEVVRAFVRALSKGYDDAIRDPEAAAEILVEAVPELDAELVLASQTWLSPRYRADATRWGEQDRQVWFDYARWMLDNGIIDEMIDVDAAFTNEFLP